MTGDGFIKRLERIRERAGIAEGFDALQNITRFELVPLLTETPGISDEYERRVSYIATAIDSHQCQELLAAIRKGLEEARLSIDASSADKSEYVQNWYREISDPNTWISMRPTDAEELKLGMNITEEERAWCHPDHAWKKRLEHYRHLVRGLRMAEALSAIPRNISAPIDERISAALKELETLLDGNYHRLHIESFQNLKLLDADPTYVSGIDGQIARDTIEDVCSEMMLFFELQPKTKGKKSKARFSGDNRLIYNKKEHILAKDSEYAHLCQKVYEVCQQIGSSIAVSGLYEALRPMPHSSDPVSRYKWVYQTMDSANRWAEKDGLPYLFRMKDKKVVRLI